MQKTVFAALTAALLLTLTACGGTEETTAAPAPSGGPGDRTALAECLKEHGVTLPEGGFRNRPSDRPSDRPSGEPRSRPSGFPSMDGKMREAFEACGGGRRQMDDSALNAFRTCMKDNGAEVGSFRDVNRDDPAIRKALEKCRPLMPSTS
ncbi:hypothetical protein [Herbidospora sp. NBRC 101105]|uniref:hypothetical protein n=1 Tax=Herbidospora sp. NBRC 101105 TaxID=3032195 RepID=UPI0024A3F5EB|nr:hypothetical protein [Herbidospora sp. NBRC 101105]GLX98639.1 hypothetical protein Hesp01_65890 [Herbidospora sp. NBRC 101105]